MLYALCFILQGFRFSFRFSVWGLKVRV
jgi:hypothetical protein